MAEEKILMDTNVFSSIVEEIRGAASECVFPENALEQAGNLATFNAGRKMRDILAELHKTDEIYRQESSEALPHAFLTIRDSIIEVDKDAGDKFTVEKKYRRQK